MSMENIGYYYWREYFQNLYCLNPDRFTRSRIKLVLRKELEVKTSVLNERYDRLCGFKYEQGKKVESYLSAGQAAGFCLRTVYPGLLTGIGMPHEVPEKNTLKLGFYFDHTTGLPVIPGATCKGVLRSAFPQWENHLNEPEEIKTAKTEYIYRIVKGIKEDQQVKIGKSEIELVNFIENEIFEGRIGEQQLPVYSRDIFFDAYIVRGTLDEKRKDCIMGTDFITPHFKDNVFSEKSLLKNPEPIFFLKVLPDVVFKFQFLLNDNHEWLDKEKQQQRLLTEEEKLKLFRKIILDLGIGAKTHVGYGQFVLVCEKCTK